MKKMLYYNGFDEVDSILIDEARTPLIISGAAEDSSARYIEVNKLIPSLTRGYAAVETQPEVAGDFIIDEKQRSVELTEAGHEKVEALLIKAGLLPDGESLYSPTNLILFHHVMAGVRAHHVFHRDVDYLVQDDQVVIVDEHTGRTMPGRRWSEGLHQAVEAKEGLSVQKENQTLASTTFQNYFRLYDKLSGMTGTADTEAFELREIYGLDVVVIPTNQTVVRKDANDLVYLSEVDKYAAVIEEIKKIVAEQRPVLVGTASVEASERISLALDKAGMKHNARTKYVHNCIMLHTETTYPLSTEQDYDLEAQSQMAETKCFSVVNHNSKAPTSTFNIKKLSKKQPQRGTKMHVQP